MADSRVKWQASRDLKLCLEKRANIIGWPTFVERAIRVVNVPGYGGLTHGAQAPPLGIKREYAQRLGRPSLIDFRNSVPDADRPIGLKDEECVRIVAARVYQVGDTVRACASILKVTARIRLITRPEEIVPVEGKHWMQALSPEMLYVLAEGVYVALAISAATALHRFKTRSDFRLVIGGDILPRVRPVTITTQAGWRVADGAIEFSHVTRPPADSWRAGTVGSG
jgi:hypothetical protein